MVLQQLIKWVILTGDKQETSGELLQEHHALKTGKKKSFSTSFEYKESQATSLTVNHNKYLMETWTHKPSKTSQVISSTRPKTASWGQINESSSKLWRGQIQTTGQAPRQTDGAPASFTAEKFRSAPAPSVCGHTQASITCPCTIWVGGRNNVVLLRVWL